jgi:hypothetical protein
MIRLLTAFTFEIDDPRLAVDEILEQLDMKHSLLKNSAGFLFCSLDFISSGTATAVSGAIPFEVIGCTTHGIVMPGVMDENVLAVAVLTSDDVFFRTGLSGPLDADGDARVKEMYESLSGSAGASPSLMLICHSNPDCFSGDMVVDILDRISGGTPIFGTNALDETIENRTPLVIYDRSFYSNRLALLAVYGAVECRFEIESLLLMNIYSKPAIVTEAQANRLISINNVPAVDFMENLGIVSKNKLNAVYGFPLLIDNDDGAGPKSCAIHSIEDGGVLRCGSVITKGATLKLGNQIQEEVLRSSEQFAKALKEEGGKKSHLIFSCFGRSAPLVELKDEMRLFQKCLEGIPYVFIYSGGEFCPTRDKQGEIRNAFHQFSIISLSF